MTMNTSSIPRHWTPRQALAYLDLLEQLHHAIWHAYEDSLVELIIADLHAPDDSCESLEPEIDDDIPF